MYCLYISIEQNDAEFRFPSKSVVHLIAHFIAIIIGELSFICDDLLLGNRGN